MNRVFVHETGSVFELTPRTNEEQGYSRIEVSKVAPGQSLVIKDNSCVFSVRAGDAINLYGDVSQVVAWLRKHGMKEMS